MVRNSRKNKVNYTQKEAFALSNGIFRDLQVWLIGEITAAFPDYKNLRKGLRTSILLNIHYLLCRSNLPMRLINLKLISSSNQISFSSLHRKLIYVTSFKVQALQTGFGMV